MRRRGLSLPIAVSALSLLLVLLATLQYRWAGQISEAEMLRMHDFARTRAEQLGQELDRELTHAFLGLGVDPSLLRENALDRYAERYARWRHRAMHPELVAAVYLSERDAGGRLGLKRFDPVAGSFSDAAWPADLARLRRTLEEHLLEGRGRGPTPLVAESLPALVVPIPARVRGPNGELREPFGRIRFLGYTLVVLDRAYLQRDLLPTLARHYFGGSRGLDYDLRIVPRDDPGRVVFASDPTVAFRRADATADLMGLRFDLASSDDLGWLAPWQAPRAARAGESSPQPPPAPGGRRLGGRFSGPGAGLWQLEVQHRAGSVEAVVAAARRRNLLVGFGVLLLLGASMWMIALSSQRAARLAQRQLEFVAGVSHELRTPVATICSAGENLADGHVRAGGEIRQHGVVVRDAGRRLAALVEEVLEFAGTYSGRPAFRSEPVEVAAVVREALEALGEPLRAGGFEVGVEIAPNLDAVGADPAALRRALQNLLENAIKYSGASRSITLRASAGGARGRQSVSISVEDHGLGIAPEDAPHVFEPFYRGQAAAESRVHGSGLGLCLAKGIAEAHRGSLSFESAPGRGSVFRLTLPSLTASAEDAAHQQSLEDHGHPHPAR
jgi:signal transduction histidine kinase